MMTERDTHHAHRFIIARIKMVWVSLGILSPSLQWYSQRKLCESFCQLVRLMWYPSLNGGERGARQSVTPTKSLL